MAISSLKMPVSTLIEPGSSLIMEILSIVRPVYTLTGLPSRQKLFLPASAGFGVMSAFRITFAAFKTWKHIINIPGNTLISAQ
jgi:hypothetical protein